MKYQSWICIDRKMAEMWKEHETEQSFLEAVAKEFKWSKRETINNTYGLIDRLKQ